MLQKDSIASDTVDFRITFGSLLAFCSVCRWPTRGSSACRIDLSLLAKKRTRSLYQLIQLPKNRWHLVEEDFLFRESLGRQSLVCENRIRRVQKNSGWGWHMYSAALSHMCIQMSTFINKWKSQINELFTDWKPQLFYKLLNCIRFVVYLFIPSRIYETVRKLFYSLNNRVWKFFTELITAHTFLRRL